MKKTRIETDSLGQIELPENALYGAQTQRAIDNFPISGLKMPTSVIQNFGLLKMCCAMENLAANRLETNAGNAIIKAAEEVWQGKHDDQFPVDIFQTGSGTSTNMNVNEVIANRANVFLGGQIGDKKPVHPNDHVNMGQSSNDTFPTVMHLAALQEIKDRLMPEVENLQTALNEKASAFDNVVKVARTHLQDAVPIRLGQEFSSYATLIADSLKRMKDTQLGLESLALGGTAVGTGLNAPQDFAVNVIARMSQKTKLPLRQASNLFAALSGKDAILGTSSALRSFAVSLTKIANDLRWLSSGPHCGIGEIKLPALQPGSSIMPGKINPVIPEAVLMVCAQVIGCDQTVMLGAQAGNFELNVMMPVMIYNVIFSIELLSNAIAALTNRCIRGIEPNRERCRELLEKSLILVTALAPKVGYDTAAALVKKSMSTGKTLRQVAKEANLMPDEELEKLLDPMRMTGMKKTE